MASSGKKRTTMAKLNREGKLREKRLEKQARKAARRLSAACGTTQVASRPGGLGTVVSELDRDGPEADSGLVAPAGKSAAG